MASAWGNAWAQAWGNSWGQAGFIPVEIDDDAVQLARDLLKKHAEAEEAHKLKFKQDLEDTLQETFDRLHGITPEVTETVTPYIKAKARKKAIHTESVNWRALTHDVTATRILLDQLNQALKEQARLDLYEREAEELLLLH